MPVRTSAIRGVGEERSAAFRTTLWSEVLAARDAVVSPVGEQALATLCSTYWYPLYAYARGCGFSPEDSQDLTQGFFSHWMEDGLLGGIDRERGRFRWFLLRSFQNALRNELERMRALKRGGGRRLVSWDALEGEQRYQAEPVDHTSPDVMYDRRWARATLGRALDRLGIEFAAAGRGELFVALKGYLGASGAGSSYGEVATRLGISMGAVKVTVHRLRQRYRDLVRQEVAQTLADPAEVEDELRHLATLLAR
ncbi:MAG: sigma-70 family RNA polymerase sigma factor [Verrucomicrobiae bacterium]|nr:sigma-70 family RNA polymerase sigma factor [Verrucomicrobiae bacterium]